MANRYALLIGTSEYQDEHLARLKTPAADLNVLASLLGDQNIGGYQVKVLLNQPFNTVLREIVSFLKDRLRDDHLLLYFSGHGVLDEGGNLYLATKDTERDLLSATALSNRFIKDELDKSRSKRQVLILDTCHSGAFLRGTKGDSLALTQATFEGYGRAVLTAADSIQYALEGDQVDEGLELSLFTHFLVEGIQTGEADRSNDGWIELDEWFDYAFRKVRDHTDRQTPRKFVDNQYGELYIARNPKANEIKPAELPERLRARVKSEYKPDRHEAIQELGSLLDSDDPSMVMAAQIAMEKISAEDDSLSIRNNATMFLAQHAERLAVKKAEDERRAREKAEAERLAALKAEEERRAREKAEAQRLKALEAEGKRLARERAEAERQAALRAKEEREQAEAERLAAVKAEEERKQAEANRIAVQREEQERLAQEMVAAEQLAAQPVEAGRMAGAVAVPELPAIEKPGARKLIDALPRWAIWIELVLVGGSIVGLIVSRQANPAVVVSPTALQEAAVTAAPTIDLAAKTTPAQPMATSLGVILQANTPPPTVSTVEPTEAVVPFAQANGRIVFSSDRDGNREIYLMNADGSGLTRLTNNTAWDSAPAWSPDGTRIAFYSDRGGHLSIYVMNSDGSEQTRLTNGSEIYWSPTWSPNGMQIAFTSLLLNGTDAVGQYMYVMNADGSHQTRLAYNFSWISSPAWSPDGTRIAFVSDQDIKSEIYVVYVDSLEQVRLTHNSAYDDSPAWSPDSSRIAFTSERDGNAEIYSMNADGAGLNRLTNNSASDDYPAWSPDGTHIAFTSDRDGNDEIYVMNADGSGQTRLTDTSADDAGPAWQP